MRILIAGLVAMSVGGGFANEARAGAQTAINFDSRIVTADYVVGSTTAPPIQLARHCGPPRGHYYRGGHHHSQYYRARPYGAYYRGAYGPRSAYPVAPYPVSPYPVPGYPAPVYPPAYAVPSGGSSFGLYIGF